ncbi:hypothetical protein ACFY5A_05935 [Microbacterium sp. NPDC012755]|uniref:hypothetical protein n=1 Tax=Microbacterium sp. NPDC012755 TaxID=3364184 RepID=UPI0036B5B924
MDAVNTTGTGASGLASRAARWVMVAVWASGVASGVLAGHFSPPRPLLMLAYLVALAGAVLLTDPRDRPLTGLRALSIPAATLSITLLVLIEGTAAKDVWLIDYAAYLVALQVARGNLVTGLSGTALQVAAVLIWAEIGGQDAGGVANMLAIPVSVAVLGLLWRGILRGMVGRERRHRSAAAESERMTRALDAASGDLQRELDAIRAQVSPTLRMLRDGGELTEEALTGIRILEGAIRDRIRSPRLQHPALNAAAAQARARAVSITMLSDAEDERVLGDAAATRVAQLVTEAPSGATAVITVGGEQQDAVTVVLDVEGTHHRYVVVDADPAR